MIELNKIHNMDCLEYMKTVPDNFYDLCLTDPPYGIKINKMNFVTSGAVKVGGAYRNDYSKHNTEWDNFTPSIEYFNEIKRISKQQIIFGGNYFTDFLEPTPSWLIWDKRTEDKYSNDFADCEMAWNSDKKPARIYRFLYSGMIQQDMKNKMNVSIATVKRLMSELQKDGRITRIGSNRSGKWQINDSNFPPEIRA